MWKVNRYIVQDLLKNRVIWGYTLLLLLTGWGTFMMESQPEKALLMLLQVVLFALPLITMVFATIYYYNSMEFIVLLLAQPVKRNAIIGSFFTGLVMAFSGSFLLGVGLPLLLFYPSVESLLLIATGILLTMVFIAIALFICTLTNDKTRGMGITLLLWAFFAFIFDGLLLYLMYQLGDYPIEKAVLAVSFLNPIDIARITVIMKTEASALLGLSGAVFLDFFGSSFGLGLSLFSLLVWILAPFALARRFFRRKDM